MKKWIKLVDCEETEFWRGMLLCFSASYPFEDKVVMMLSQHRMGEEPFDLVTITGHKSGINPYVVFPKESQISSDKLALSKEWLIQNWTKWVWPDGDVNDVWVSDSLEVSEVFK